MSLVSILVTGFLLGMQHATEADHLAAVAALATRESTLSHALRQGLAWGCGHTVTLMLTGGIALELGTALPPFLEPALECAVGLMLVLLGADVLRRLPRDRPAVRTYRHEPGGVQRRRHHSAPDAGGRTAGSGTPRFADLRFVRNEPTASGPMLRDEHRAPLPMRALAVGMMHGLAGSAALIVLSLQAVDSVATGLLYIATFGIGSMAGMALLSIAIAVPLRLSTRHLGALHAGITAAVGLLGLGLGIAMIARSLLR